MAGTLDMAVAQERHAEVRNAMAFPRMRHYVDYKTTISSLFPNDGMVDARPLREARPLSSIAPWYLALEQAAENGDSVFHIVLIAPQGSPARTPHMQHPATPSLL